MASLFGFRLVRTPASSTTDTNGTSRAALAAENARLTEAFEAERARADNLDRLLTNAIPAMVNVGSEVARILRVEHFTVGLTPGHDGAEIIAGFVTIRFLPRQERIIATGEMLPRSIEMAIPDLAMGEVLQFALKGVALKPSGPVAAPLVLRQCPQVPYGIW